MVARKLELKVDTWPGVNGGPAGQLHYGEMMRQIIGYAAPGLGLVLSEVLAALDAEEPLKAAIAAGADHVTLTEEQYKLLRDKLESFPWGVVTPAIGKFGLMIRNAPEIT